MKEVEWLVLLSAFASSFFLIERIAASFQHNLMKGFLFESQCSDGKDELEQQVYQMILMHFLFHHLEKAYKLFREIKI